MVTTVLVVGLTGGIGAGKSTVAAGLAARGAVIVDADLIARQVVEPGTPGLDAIVDRFGSGVLSPAGGLDRQALADQVFANAEARAALEAITHPAIQGEMAAQVLAHALTDDVVVMDIPLLKEKREPMRGVIVVDVDPEIAVDRLVRYRGFDEGDARKRVAAQIDRDKRRTFADVVIDNSGDEAHLDAEVSRAWAWIEGLRSAPPG